MVPLGCPETSVANNQSTLCNITGEQRCHLNFGARSQSSCFITVAKFIKNISTPLGVFRSFRPRNLNNGHLRPFFLWGGPGRDWFRCSFRGLGHR